MSILQWNVIRVLKSRTSVTWWGPWSTDFLLWQLSLRHHPDGCVQWRRELRFIIQQPAKKDISRNVVRHDLLVFYVSVFPRTILFFWGFVMLWEIFCWLLCFFECRFLGTDVLLQSTGFFHILFSSNSLNKSHVVTAREREIYSKIYQKTILSTLKPHSVQKQTSTLPGTEKKHPETIPKPHLRSLRTQQGPVTWNQQWCVVGTSIG